MYSSGLEVELRWDITLQTHGRKLAMQLLTQTRKGDTKWKAVLNQELELSGIKKRT